MSKSTAKEVVKRQNKVAELRAGGFTYSEIYEIVTETPHNWDISLSMIKKYGEAALKDIGSEYLADTPDKVKRYVQNEIKAFLQRYKKAHYGERDRDGFWIQRPNQDTAHKIRLDLIAFLEKVGVNLHLFGEQNEGGENNPVITQIIREVVYKQDDKEESE